MLKSFFITVLIFLMPLSLYAGHGTIRETDTEIFVEYYGDDNEIQAARIVKEEENKQKEAELREREKTRVHKEERLKMRAAEKTKSRKEDE